MAKITVVVDTEVNALEVAVDGVVQENVDSVTFYKCSDWYGTPSVSVNISMSEKPDEKGGIHKMTYLMAKSREAKTSSCVATVFDGLVKKTDNSKVLQDITDLFMPKKSGSK